MQTRESAPDVREPLSGLVERVTFHNSDNGFCVLRVKVRGHRDLVTLLGDAASVSVGEYIQASGRWETHRDHGQQFRATFLRVTPPTSAEGMERYLGSGLIKGIGAIFARRLVVAFGEAGLRDYRERAPKTAWGRRNWSQACGADYRQLVRSEGDSRDHGLPARPRG